jgi:hypothetical protein
VREKSGMNDELEVLKDLRFWAVMAIGAVPLIVACGFLWFEA